AQRELDSIIMRNVALLVILAMFVYVGAYFARMRKRLADLAAWPAGELGVGEFPAIEPFFTHSADVVGAARAVAIWEWPDEPFCYFAYWADGRCEYGQVPPGVLGDQLEANDSEKSFWWSRQNAGNKSGDTVSPEIIARFKIDQAVVSPFRRTICR